MFVVGDIVATPGALDLLDRHAVNATAILRRHICGDFGVTSTSDSAENLFAIDNEARILSAYQIGEGDTAERLWVVTEADRSVTTLLLPSEY